MSRLNKNGELPRLLERAGRRRGCLLALAYRGMGTRHDFAMDGPGEGKK